jgi:hypothetical protein
MGIVNFFFKQSVLNYKIFVDKLEFLLIIILNSEFLNNIFPSKKLYIIFFLIFKGYCDIKCNKIIDFLKKIFKK